MQWVGGLSIRQLGMGYWSVGLGWLGIQVAALGKHGVADAFSGLCWCQVRIRRHLHLCHCASVLHGVPGGADAAAQLASHASAAAGSVQ